MTEVALPAEAPPRGSEISIVRLHGEACYWCGAALGALFPAGTVETPAPGGVQVWPIVACVEHRGGKAS